MESDPVKIAVEGEEAFKENCDPRIAGTSGRQKQEAFLFEEMNQVAEATKSYLIIYVGMSVLVRLFLIKLKHFKQNAEVGAVIVTKMDDHGKGGGTLNAVAAAKSPAIFFGTGGNIDEFEVFHVKTFVNHLLGMSD